MNDDRARLYSRARAICSAPESAGVERLAIHIAFATTLSVDEARKAMAVAQNVRGGDGDDRPAAPVLPALQ